MTDDFAGIGEKIIVLGCPGSGKSTFSRRLSEITHLPLFPLDAIWWKADRTHITRDEFDSQLAAILRGGQWILDGDYSRTYEVRFRACDTVIFLDFPEEVCLGGIEQRLGEARPDLPWTDFELDPALVQQVRAYAAENRSAIVSLIGKYPEKNAIVFRTRKEADDWLQAVAERTSG